VSVVFLAPAALAIIGRARVRSCCAVPADLDARLRGADPS
jgi:hypothetical protein